MHSSELESLTTKSLGPRELTLTCKGLSCVNWDCGVDDFEFVFGEDKVCQLHSVLAEFLSPKVARLRRCDPFYNVYTFKNSESFRTFENVLSRLRAGQTFQVETSNFVAILRLSQELENSELLCSLLEMINPESLSLEEAIVLLRSGTDLGTAFGTRFDDVRDFVASHFYEIEEGLLDTLDLEIAQIILSSPSLKIADEDSLYDFVRSRSQNDLRFTGLFEYVYFEYLSVDRIQNFASFASQELLENINSGIWSRICGRLIREIKLNEKNPRAFNEDNQRAFTSPGIEFAYDGSKPLQGVMAYLTRECGGNVHDKGIVNVTASSVWKPDSYWHPKNIADVETNGCSGTKNIRGSYFCYEFKQGRSLIPTSYSVESFHSGPGGEHLQSWVIEVSHDGTENSWQEIDRRENNNELNGLCVTRNFKISRVPIESFEFIRLRQTGPNHGGNDCLNLTSFELFGTLFRK